MATTEYDDIYVRDNFQDTGAYPTTGAPYQSPDIIPYQSNILSYSTANTDYNSTDIGMAIKQTSNNNIYIRAYNLGSAAQTGTVKLFYTKASLLMAPDKTDWNSVNDATGISSIDLVYVDASGATKTSIPSNTVAISNTPFFLAGLPSVTNDHYCLIGIVNTPTHPITVPQTFATNAAFVSWVQNNPAVCWRNITIVANDQAQIVKVMKFGNLNGIAEIFNFQFICDSAVTFAIGTTVEVQCANAHLTFTEQVTLSAPVGGSQLWGFVKLVPSLFSGAVTVTITAPTGQTFPVGAQLTTNYYQNPSTNPTDELEKSVVQDVLVYKNEGESEVQSLIPVGECQLIIGS